MQIRLELLKKLLKILAGKTMEERAGPSNKHEGVTRMLCIYLIWSIVIYGHNMNQFHGLF